MLGIYAVHVLVVVTIRANGQFANTWEATKKYIPFYVHTEKATYMHDTRSSS